MNDDSNATTRDADPLQLRGELTHELKVPEYSRAAGPVSSSTRQVLHLGLRRRSLTPARPDPQTPPLTGQWESLGGPGGPITVCINRAGKHIECWISRVGFFNASIDSMPSVDGTPMRRVFAFGGDLEQNGTSFRMYESEDAAQRTLARLKTEGDNVTLVWDLPQGKRQFVLQRRTDRPTLSDHFFRLAGAGHADLQRAEWTPLLSTQLAWLNAQLNSAKLDELFREMLANQKNLIGLGAMNRVSRIIRAAVDGDPSQRTHALDRRLMSQAAAAVLSSRTLKHNGKTGTYYGWMRGVVNDLHDAGLSSQIPSTLRDDARMDIPGEGATLYKYELETNSAGAGAEFVVGLAGQIGSMTIRKVSPGPVETHTYQFFLASVSAGLSVGVGKGGINKATFESSNYWRAEDFLGPIETIGASASGGVVFGLEAGVSMLKIHGNGRHQPLSIDTGGASVAYGIGVGVDVIQAGGGYVYLEQDAKQRQEIAEDPILAVKDQTYEVSETVEDAVHFALGDAWLTETGRSYLRRLAAKELRWFMEPGAHLGIVGHTDRVDDEKSNMELSRLRAKNVVQGLKDILGEQCRVQLENPSFVRVLGMGETQAKELKRRDGFPWQPDRRVELVLNAVLVGRLTGGGS
jgi:outer membrane protein OmpA-like peptidoglycan-associated protein